MLTQTVDNATHECYDITYLVDDDVCVMDQELFEGN